MNFERYAGMASAVGLVLILLIITWLGLWGPVDLSKLEKWQTLIVGVMALVAACIAYFGATASVKFDKRNLKRSEMREKLGVYLRARYMCETLSLRAKSMAHKTTQIRRPANLVTLDDLRIRDFVDLNEAWENLELFPPETAFRLSQIHANLASLAKFVEGQDKDTSWEVGPGITYTTHMKITTDLGMDLHEDCEAIISQLDPLIQELAQSE